MVISGFERQVHLLPNMLRWLAMLGMAIGVGVWAALLFAPRSEVPPPLLSTAVGRSADMGAVSRWFGPGDLRIKVAITGVMAADNGFGAALLSVNGMPSRAFKSGDTIADGVTLDSVWPTYVVINQDGHREQVDFVRERVAPVNGFIPVP